MSLAISSFPIRFLRKFHVTIWRNVFLFQGAFHCSPGQWICYHSWFNHPCYLCGEYQNIRCDVFLSFVHRLACLLAYILFPIYLILHTFCPVFLIHIYFFSPDFFVAFSNMISLSSLQISSFYYFAEKGRPMRPFYFYSLVSNRYNATN